MTDRTNAARQARHQARAKAYTPQRQALERIATEAQTLIEARRIAVAALAENNVEAPKITA